MPEILRWPFRIVLYFFLYIAWLALSLVVLSFYPIQPGLLAENLVAGGWLTIAFVFFADLYFTQLRGRGTRKK